MSVPEWDACSWDLQRAYWEGLVAEGLVEQGQGSGESAQSAGMSSRTADTGDGVIDLAAMRDQLAGGR